MSTRWTLLKLGPNDSFSYIVPSFFLTCNILEQNLEKEWKSPIFGNTLTHLFVSQGASLVAQTVKNQPAMQATQVQSLGWEESLEKWITTQSVFLPGEFHGQRCQVDCSPWSPKELDRIEKLTLSRDLVTTQVWIILNSNTWFT